MKKTTSGGTNELAEAVRNLREASEDCMQAGGPFMRSLARFGFWVADWVERKKGNRLNA